MLPPIEINARTLLALTLALAVLMVAGPLLWQVLRKRAPLRHCLAYACCTCLLLLSGCGVRALQ